MRKWAPFLLAAAAALVASAAVSAAPPPFTPKLLAGNWTGTWVNETFGSTGPASFVVKATAKTISFTADLGGNVFGCPDPAAESSKPLPQGTGPNRWNAKGFTIKGVSKALGALTVTYAHATARLRGGGKNPNCAINLAWAVDGTFDLAARTFQGTVDITLPDGSKAVSKLSLKRS